MNTMSFGYDGVTHELLAYYHHGDEPRVLIGTVPPARAQRPAEIYAWADKQIALLGLAPIHKVL